MSRTEGINRSFSISSGALVRLNSNGTFEYNPNNQFEFLQDGQSETDTFSYTLSDGNGGTDRTTVSITINGVNDNPIAIADEIRTNEINVINGNVLNNDTDPENDELIVTQVNGSIENVGNQIPLTSGALLTLNSDGTYSFDPNGQFEELDAGDTGFDSFEYTISDGNGGTSTTSVSVIINGIADPFGLSFSLSSLNGNNGFAVNGAFPDSEAGFSVADAGDINGDGFDDVVIGAPNTDRTDFYRPGREGETYVVFGDTSFDETLNLSELEVEQGFFINGIIDEGLTSRRLTTGIVEFGESVSNAGDVNGDGFDDFIIGAPDFMASEDDDGGGAAFIVLGRSESFGNELELEGFDDNGVIFIGGGREDDFVGTTVSEAGDFNNDGFDDVLITEPGDSEGEQTRVFVLYGREDLSSLGLFFSEGQFIERFQDEDGLILLDNVGSDASSAGDINNDGFSDLIISNQNNQVTIVYGSDREENLELNNLGNEGFTVNGIGTTDRLGTSVSNAGDVNSDGIDDLIIGAPGVNNNSGEAFVIFGRTDRLSGNFDLNSLDGSNGFKISSSSGDALLGTDVATVGDINSDGFNDIAVTAPDEGKLYVVFGRDEFNNSINVDNLEEGEGFVVEGLSDSIAVSAAGDVNNDGVGDIIIGDSNANEGAGKSYVIFGRPSQRNSATSNGDPYITTFDGLFYESSATGEFIAVKSDLDDFEIQVRQENTFALFDGDNPNGTYNTALAIKIGDHRVGLYAGEEENKLRIDGEIVEFSINETIELEGGSVTPTENFQFIVTHDNGSQLIATVFSDLIDYEVSLSQNLGNSVTGILGNNNGDAFDDYQLRDGTVLPQGLSEQELYEQFAASWRTTQSESLFDYENNTNTIAFSNLLVGNNNLIGTSSDDTLFAQAGNDILVGADGNDTLNGGDGEDTIIGGLGDDNLNGGAESDTFVFRSNFGNDRILDFSAEDNLDIDSVEEIKSLNQINTDVVIEFESGDSITLVNTNTNVLGESFISVV